MSNDNNIELGAEQSFLRTDPSINMDTRPTSSNGTMKRRRPGRPAGSKNKSTLEFLKKSEEAIQQKRLESSILRAKIKDKDKELKVIRAALASGTGDKHSLRARVGGISFSLNQLQKKLELAEAWLNQPEESTPQKANRPVSAEKTYPSLNGLAKESSTRLTAAAVPCALCLLDKLHRGVKALVQSTLEELQRI